MKKEKEIFIDGFKSGWSSAVKRMMDILLDVKTEVFMDTNKTSLNNVAQNYFNKIEGEENAEKKESKKE